MKKLLIAIICTVTLLSCQKEIGGELSVNKGETQVLSEANKCKNKFSFTRTTIDLEWETINALDIGDYYVCGHPKMLNKYTKKFWMEKCKNKVVSKGEYDGPGELMIPYLQIGGTADAGWFGHEKTTYFFIKKDFSQFTEQVGDIFQP